MTDSEPHNPSPLSTPTVVVVTVESTAASGRKAEARVKPVPVTDGASVAIVVGCGDERADDCEEEEEELQKGCRICHLSSEGKEQKGSELIQLGCSCKGELGIAHRQCAEAWFKVKGNRFCEICGANAKNITGVEDARFMEEWHERSELDTRDSSESSCWRRQPFCNFLMACLVIAFMFPWFFRVNMF